LWEALVALPLKQNVCLVVGCKASYVETSPSGLVLGIESSCDDTGVAILTQKGEILGEVCSEAFWSAPKISPAVERGRHAVSFNISKNPSIRQSRRDIRVDVGVDVGHHVLPNFELIQTSFYIIWDLCSTNLLDRPSLFASFCEASWEVY
jgi:hypothetical protein